MINWTGDKPNHPAGHCQFCGYNLFSIQGELCPECGNSRRAWVEVACEECHKICVYPIEEADRVQSCQFCRKAIDVPPATTPLAPLTASIAKTRLAMMSFIIMTVIIGLFAGMSDRHDTVLELLDIRPTSQPAPLFESRTCQWTCCGSGCWPENLLSVITVVEVLDNRSGYPYD